MAGKAKRPEGIVNWTDLHPFVRTAGHIRAAWRDLGRAAGTRTVGARRLQVEDGHFASPVHVHGGEEEIYFVLDGSGLLWQGGETFAIAAGDCIVHRAGGEPHTLRGGAGGLDVIAFGQRGDPRLRYLPRAGIAYTSPNWVALAGGATPYEREAQAGPPDCPPPKPARPDNVVALAEVLAQVGGVLRRLGAAAGAQASGLNHVALAPESSGAPPHCHSHEEELFVILEGSGTLVLYARGGREPAEHPLRPGDVISRPAATGVAHALRSGAEGMTFLAYGTRDGGDCCFYPEAGIIAMRGLGISFRPEGLQALP